MDRPTLDWSADGVLRMVALEYADGVQLDDGEVAPSMNGSIRATGVRV